MRGEAVSTAEHKHSRNGKLYFGQEGEKRIPRFARDDNFVLRGFVYLEDLYFEEKTKWSGCGLGLFA